MVQWQYRKTFSAQNFYSKGAPCGVCRKAETMEKILNATELWKDFDPAAEPLDVNVITQTERDGVTVKSFYFTGREVSDGKTRVYAKVCRPADKSPRRALLLVEDYTRPIDEQELAYWAKKDFVVMAIDFAGRCPKGCFTLYPFSLDYCNADKAKSYFDVGETAKESKIYEYAVGCMRAVTCLLTQEKVKSVSLITVKKGARVGTVVLGADSRINYGVVVFNSLYREYPQHGGTKNWTDESLPERLAYEEKRQKWIAGIAPQSYAIKMKCPVYLIVSANSLYDDVTNANRMFCRINSDSRLLLLPAVMDCLPEEYVLGIVRWVKGSAAEDSAEVRQFSDDKGDNYVVVSGKFKQTQVSLWYAREGDTCARNWVSAPLKKTEEGLVARLDCYGEQTRIAAFATVKGSIAVSSMLEEFTVNAPDRIDVRTRSLYEGREQGFLIDFGGSNWHSAQGGVQYVKGYLDIRGAKGKNIATFAICDPKVLYEKGLTVSFDVSCKARQQLRVYALSDVGSKNTAYVAQSQLVGGGRWQRITLEHDDFHMTKDGHQMPEDEIVQLLAFQAEEEFMLNNVFLV